jgi:hypothetical protein
MTVDTGPGRGCRVTVVFPLSRAKPPVQQIDPSGNQNGTARSA